MSVKKTAKHYHTNARSYAKKKAYDKEFGARRKNVKKRVELNRINRQKGTAGNGDGLDVSHQKDGSTTMEKASANRGRKEKSRLKGSSRKRRG